VHAPLIHRLGFKMAAARPLVTVQGLDGAAGEQSALPAVFTAPIRPDIVRTVHTNMAKNSRCVVVPRDPAGAYLCIGLMPRAAVWAPPLKAM
jgi:hypothetical protein